MGNRHEQRHRPGAAYPADEQPGRSNAFPEFPAGPRERPTHRPGSLQGLPREPAIDPGSSGSAAVGWPRTMDRTTYGQDLVRFDAAEGDQAVFTRAAGRW